MRRFCLAVVLLSSFTTACDAFEPTSTDGGTTNGGVGDPCTEQSNCRLGLVCDPVTMTCQPSGEVLEGGVCALTGDCMDGLFCGPLRTCVASGSGADGADCQNTADCERGLVCTLEGFGLRCRETGDGDLGAGCRSETECLAGLTCAAVEGGALRCVNPPPLSGDGLNGMLPPTIPLWQGATCQDDDGPAQAYFHVRRGDDTDRDFYRLPFPNDVLRSASGLDLTGHPTPATAVSVDVLGRHLDAAAELRGFATNPVIYFRFSRPYEWADVNAESVLLIDLTPGSPDFGNNVNRTWLTTFGQITRYICPDWLSIRRGHGDPLRPGSTYAAILTSSIRTSAMEGGEAFTRSSDLDAILGDAAPSGEPLASAWTAYAPLRDWLGRTDTLNVGEVLNATVFTTQDPNAIVPALRRAVRAQPAPTITDITLCDTGVTSPCDDGEQRVCSAANEDFYEVHARIALPRFQTGTPPYETPEDGGDIETDAAGTPLVQGTESVCMVMTIPKGVAEPLDGFPVVFYGHGTGGAFTSPVANGLAAQFAGDDGGSGAPHAITVGIDMPLHGTRLHGSSRSPDQLVFNFLNPRAARGNFLQGAADLQALVFWAETYAMAAADAPTDYDVRFNPARVAVWGHSQGASHAMLMLPYEPGVVAGLISGGGGDLTESLLSKTRPINIAATVPLALLDADAGGALVAGDQHPALALFQMYYESVDPVNFGRLYHRSVTTAGARHIFMTYGVGDSFSTERTMHAFALAASMPVAAPELVALGTGTPLATPIIGNVTIDALPFTVALRQYMPNTGDDGHFVATQTTQGRADATRFVLEALSGAVPPIGE